MTNLQSNEKVSSSLSTKRSRIPIRYFLIFNSFFAFIIVYANKVVLSVAIVAMVSEPLAPPQNNNNLLSSNNPINSSLSKPSFAALHSKANLTTKNNSLFNQLNRNHSLLNQSILQAISHNPAIKPQRTNQVSYNHTTKAKVLRYVNFFWCYLC